MCPWGERQREDYGGGGRYGWNDWILGIKGSWEGILGHVPKWEMIVTLRCKKRGGLYPVSCLEPWDEQPGTSSGQWCGNIKWSKGTWSVCSWASLVLLCSSLTQPSVPSHRCGLQTQRSLTATKGTADLRHQQELPRKKRTKSGVRWNCSISAGVGAELQRLRRLPVPRPPPRHVVVAGKPIFLHTTRTEKPSWGKWQEAATHESDWAQVRNDY